MNKSMVCFFGALSIGANVWAANTDTSKLARDSGCLTCHAIESGAKGPDGMAPIGPPWRDVAAKYKGRKDAVEMLTKVVMTGSSPYESHWKGKVSGLAMPPNAVVVKDAEARKLVTWILALEPKK